MNRPATYVTCCRVINLDRRHQQTDCLLNNYVPLQNDFDTKFTHYAKLLTFLSNRLTTDAWCAARGVTAFTVISTFIWYSAICARDVATLPSCVCSVHNEVTWFPAVLIVAGHFIAWNWQHFQEICPIAFCLCIQYSKPPCITVRFPRFVKPYANWCSVSVVCVIIDTHHFTRWIYSWNAR